MQVMTRETPPLPTSEKVFTRWILAAVEEVHRAIKLHQSSGLIRGAQACQSDSPRADAKDSDTPWVARHLRLLVGQP